MNIETIFRLLKNAGFTVLGTDGTFIHLEDPSCILRSFETFINYAWIFIAFITGVLLFGWAIAYIRGSKIDSLFTNFRNLILIFGTLTAVKPAVNMIWGGDVFARGCKTINVSIAEVRKILDTQNLKLARHNVDDIYEDFDIYDSGSIDTSQTPDMIPYSQAPVYSSGNPQNVSVSINSNSVSGLTASTALQSSAYETFYLGTDGKEFKRVSGTIAWRNNNPGNIRYSKFAVRNGAIGQAGGFAVFPNEETGRAAIKSLLLDRSYNTLTVAEAISQYAPPNENDTANYQRTIGRLTGLSIDLKINQLNDDQLQNMTNAIKQIEGWKVGQEVMI
ncbi:MAG TPA: hypothetical protein PKJ33_04060 [Alphaproteobacteria bacterium]|nr:hypothetical protein [Alphaproteobacteria bacterium]